MSQKADVDVVTFGCRLNAVESEAIRRAARAAGHEDLVVFNTCAVTQEAVRQARQAIRRTRRERPDARIVVTGCAAQIDPQSFVEIADAANPALFRGWMIASQPQLALVEHATHDIRLYACRP